MKPTFKTKLILILVLFWSISLILVIVSADSNTSSEIKEGRIVINEPSSQGSFFISTNSEQDNNQIVSPVIRADFSFNAFYTEWQYKEKPQTRTATDFTLYVKFLNENWSDWIKVQLDDDYQGKDDPQATLSSQLIINKLTDSFQYKLVFSSEAQKNNLKSLQLIYLDTTKGPRGQVQIATTAKGDDLKIISRAEWGANENYRYDSDGNDLWPEEYYLPQKFVIHHTAGEKANADPKATIRAIQYWHAVGKGWGDIGYNYLIDAQGNIYEGRQGGDGVVGGHAYMRNRNTIGIAILGCYQGENQSDNETDCNTPDQLTPATETALNKLIAKKSQEFNIDPNGQSDFHGQILPNVVGHKDVGSTLCPGNLIYKDLSQIRTLAANQVQTLGGFAQALPTAAQFIKISTANLDIEETKTNELIVEFKNTGQSTWRGYDDAGVYITDDSAKKKLSQIGAATIALANTNTPDVQAAVATSSGFSYQLIGGNVKPGEIGKFKLTFSAPVSKSENRKLVLAWKNKGYFPNSDFGVTLNRIACDCQNNTNINTNTNITPINNTPAPSYKAEFVESNLPDSILANESVAVQMRFKNIGNQAWQQGQLKLKIYYEKDHISPLRNDSWYSESADIIPTASQIDVNYSAYFNFNLRAPSMALELPHTLILLYNGQELYRLDKTISIKSNFAAQITDNTIPIALKTIWRPKVKLTFKNTGSQTWSDLILKSYDIDYTNSWFRDYSWQNKKTVKTIKKSVAPGESITFEFRLQPYWKPNTYPQVFKLLTGEQLITLDGKDQLLLYTRVDR